MVEMTPGKALGVLGGLETGQSKQPGVTFIVCCHNSTQFLPRTLECLSKQLVGPAVPWEVVLVDNGSTDGTGALAHRLWPSGHVAPMRVVEESRVGLSYARARGVAVARYEFLTFVDDDNWLDPGWVQSNFEILKDRPDVGALGGIIEAECETPMPPWFSAVSNIYATGPSSDLAGDVTNRHVLCGAGLSLRHAALVDAQQKGLTSISIDRQGTSLSAGGDSELIYCLRLAGWRVWLDRRLRLRHFLPARRLSWGYARRLAYWSAQATAERDALVYACKPPRHGLLRHARTLRESWVWQCLGAACRLLREPAGLVKAIMPAGFEGDRDVLRVEFLRGRLDGLLAARAWYAARSSEVRGVMAHLSSPSERMAVQESRPVGEEVVNA